ncbi:uncharacterized protein LOC117171793 [Belonocnema kinseyi]|uniref:uncharacterized protein LOC117171793 n=1 Tax=Belonocnema kinseyi TaxID=2817044 RepID=UPI00143CF9D1|nr:uncharacterized protein LOC117171793 [Belonocnema kinseyi]
MIGLPNLFDNDCVPALDDVAYAKLFQSQKPVEPLEGNGEDKVMRFETWLVHFQNMENVLLEPSSSSHSEETNLDLKEGEAGPRRWYWKCKFCDFNWKKKSFNCNF